MLRRLGLTLLLLLALTGCGSREPVRHEAFVFGTRIEIVLPGAAADAGRPAVAAVLREFDRLHRAYHAWQPSELTALNEALAAGRPHEASPELVALVQHAASLAAAGDHLFDPGIGRLVALWGFHRDDIVPALPDAAALAELVRRRPSIAELRVEGTRVSSRNPTVTLDFGGYLKGVALDRAAAALREHGVRHALLNIGGNILALGNRDGRDGGEAWRVGIQHPRPNSVDNRPLASLALRDGESIGTSGDYHRYFEIDGRRYCHLIDPRDGRPHAATRSVTVLIPPGPEAGTRSDAWSKPIFLAGERWQVMAKQLGIEAVLRVDASGTVMATPALRERLRIEVPDLQVQTAG